MTSDKELAERLIARGNEGRTVRLRPETAVRIGASLMRISAKPSRDEVALLLCNSKCPEACTWCKARANVIVAAYGCRLD